MRMRHPRWEPLVRVVGLDLSLGVALLVAISACQSAGRASGAAGLSGAASKVDEASPRLALADTPARADMAYVATHAVMDGNPLPMVFNWSSCGAEGRVATESVSAAISDRLEKEKMFVPADHVPPASYLCFSRIMVKGDSAWIGGHANWREPIAPLLPSGLPGTPTYRQNTFCLTLVRSADVWRVVQEIDAVRVPPAPRCKLR